MKGQRTSFIRGTLALLLCAILLSTFFTSTVFGGRTDPPEKHGSVVAKAPGSGDGSPSDGGGNGDPPTDGDPDDYDKTIVNVWVMLLEIPLFPI
jgi:hypothetical protein